MTKASELTGSTALVTGAGSGIGRATALLLAVEGAAVMVADIDADSARETADMIIRAGGVAEARAADVSTQEDVRAVVETTMQLWGRLDCAVNNAGIAGPQKRLDEYTNDEWRSVLAVNLDGVFYSMAAEIGVMRAAGRGAIVNVASAGAIHPVPGLAAYAASKSGILGLTRAAAGEWAGDGIRVNAVLPGATRTELWEVNAGPDREAAIRLAESVAPMRRLGQPGELAEAIVWLCSDKSSYVHGVDLLVDGGSHAFYQRPYADGNQRA